MKSHVFVRLYSSKARSFKSSKSIRKEFVDYFADLGHTIVRSSPVIPFNDRSLAFVNSGMNQFKGVFLGYHEPLASKVVNFQKCIRVGGKHNDLMMVGNDTYHHTFFEMLGNWSFNNYFKKEACQYALNLLVDQYSINKKHMYVTYFAGDDELGLKPDLECKEIWLELGIAKDKILASGMKDNFWEMGLSGPCGPCTEIHIDYMGHLTSQSSHANKNHLNPTELWNLVFIQFERLPNGSIVPLNNKYHVDTGMGFERLVALLQGYMSNYDTDLFLPLFNTINKYTNAPEYSGKFGENDENKIDYGYRILADHARMISVALVDGMVPEENYKLRRILRKAVIVSEAIFSQNNLLSKLPSIVADTLGDAYPELRNNLEQVQSIVQYEEELFKELRNSSQKQWKKVLATNPKLNIISDWTPAGLVEGYKYLHSVRENLNLHTLPGDVAFKLYDTYGLNVDIISELAEVESLSFDENVLHKELENARYKSKVGEPTKYKSYISNLNVLETQNCPKTDDSFKYNYFANADSYKFPDLQAKLLGIILDGDLILKSEDVDTNKIQQATVEIGLILDRTSCYSTEGGQTSDKGKISINDLIFNIEKVIKLNGYVIHFGNFAANDLLKSNTALQIGDSCTISIDRKVRIGAMQHHTATHLLNAALKKILRAMHQSSTAVSNDTINFTFNSFGEKLSLQQIDAVENLINSVIQTNAPVTTKTVNFSELMAEDDIALVSKETYPYDNIRIIEIVTDNLRSKEACCGTHVYNTKDLETFCFLSCAAKSRTRYTAKAVVGHLATLMKRKGESARNEISALENDFENGQIDDINIDSRIEKIRIQLTSNTTDSTFPYLIRQELLDRLEKLNKQVLVHKKQLEERLITTEMHNAIEVSPYPFIVHCLKNKTEHLSLNEIINFCPKMPILIIMYNNCKLKAKCIVPEEMVTSEFHALNWIRTVLDVFDGKCTPVRNTNPLFAANMKSKEVSTDTFASLINTAITNATKFAEASIKTSKLQDKH